MNPTASEALPYLKRRGGLTITSPSTRIIRALLLKEDDLGVDHE